jgi:uncharacterized protein Usg
MEVAMSALIEPRAPLIPNGLATIEVSYYLPDHPLLIGRPYVWQAMDYYPDYPRMLHLIDFWKDHVNAVIERILLTHQLSKGTWDLHPDKLPRTVN